MLLFLYMHLYESLLHHGPKAMGSIGHNLEHEPKQILFLHELIIPGVVIVTESQLSYPFCIYLSNFLFLNAYLYVPGVHVCTYVCGMHEGMYVACMYVCGMCVICMCVHLWYTCLWVGEHVCGIYMFMCMGACVCMCMWKPEVDN